jgi:hypothetical protein
MRPKSLRYKIRTAMTRFAPADGTHSTSDSSLSKCRGSKRYVQWNRRRVVCETVPETITVLIVIRDIFACAKTDPECRSLEAMEPADLNGEVQDRDVRTSPESCSLRHTVEQITAARFLYKRSSALYFG